MLGLSLWKDLSRLLGVQPFFCWSRGSLRNRPTPRGDFSCDSCGTSWRGKEQRSIRGAFGVLRRWLARFDPKKIVEKTALPYSLAGLPGHLCAPRRVSAGPPLFLPHSALRRRRRPFARGWPRWQLGTGQPSELPARRFQSGRRQKLRLPSPRIRRAPGRAAWPGLTLELEGCRGLLRQFASAWTPCRPFSSAKESLLNTDIIQNKNFIFFLFCFSECEQQGM